MLRAIEIQRGVKLRAVLWKNGYLIIVVNDDVLTVSRRTSSFDRSDTLCDPVPYPLVGTRSFFRAMQHTLSEATSPVYAAAPAPSRFSIWNFGQPFLGKTGCLNDWLYLYNSGSLRYTLGHTLRSSCVVRDLYYYHICNWPRVSLIISASSLCCCFCVVCKWHHGVFTWQIIPWWILLF